MGGGVVDAVALLTSLAMSMEVELIGGTPNDLLDGTSPKLLLGLLFPSCSPCNGGHEVESLSILLCSYKCGSNGDVIVNYEVY